MAIDINTLTQMLTQFYNSPELQQQYQSWVQKNNPVNYANSPNSYQAWQQKQQQTAAPGATSSTDPTYTMDARQAAASGRNVNYTNYTNQYQDPTSGNTGGSGNGINYTPGPSISQMLSPDYQSTLPKGALVYQQAGPNGAFVQDFSQAQTPGFNSNGNIYNTNSGDSVATGTLENLHNNGVANSDVNNAFMQYLGRGMSASDRSYYDNLLGSNGDPTSVINGIKNSKEAQTFGSSGQANPYQGYLDAYKQSASSGAFDWNAGNT